MQKLPSLWSTPLFSVLTSWFGRIVKNNRQSLTIAALVSRLATSVYQRYLTSSIDMWGLEEIVRWKSEELSGMMVGTDWTVSVNSVMSFYWSIWESIEPFAPTILWWWLLISLVGVIIYMFVSYTVFDEVDGEATAFTIWEKFSKIWSLIIPYMLTSLIQWVWILIWLGLFIIPWLVLGIYRSATQTVALYEEKFYFSALSRSYEIIKWRRWKTLWNLLLIWIAIWLIVSFWADLVSYLFWAFGDESVQYGAIGIITNILGLLWQVFVVLFFLSLIKSHIVEK